MSNTPQIRFVGFTDAWEQRKLGDVFVEYSEKGHDELPPLTIIQGKGTILREESERNLIYDKSGLKNYKLVNQNDFILHLRSFEGGLEKANSRGIVSPAYHIFHGENADTRFYYPFFRTKYFISVLLKPHVYGIRDGKSIDVDGMKTIDIPYPTIEEQNKIGNYFARLDSLITLHQRKCDALQKFKKSMLQKMFPQNGESVPEIRFAGFTDAWEQRKLSEISEKVSKKNQDMVVDEVFTNSAEFGIISQRDYFDKDIANSENIDGYYIVEPNDFVYNPRISTLAPFGPVRRNKLDKSGAMSPLYYVFRTHNVDCGYLEYFFKTNRWHSFMHLNGNSGARSDRFAIRDEVFRDMPISMPQDIAEQKKVGDFFSTLELAITLHQRKLETLQKMKKSLLQKMFV